MEFYDRERELARLMKIISFEPLLIHFIFGPINSGKTALIQEFVRRLPRDYAVFYINLREVYVSKADDFLKILFDVKERKSWKEIVKDVVESTPMEIPTPYGRIPIPKSIFTKLFKEREQENVFVYLRTFLGEVARKKRPILIMDELQVLKDVDVNGLLIYRLFNFFIRLTKESHICHVFCLTSDSLFVEQIYSEAMLQGRAKYMIVDDFDDETTTKFLRSHGFSDEEINLIKNYFGGKPVYLIQAIQNRDNLEEFCEEMLRIRVGEIKNMLEGIRVLGDSVTVRGKVFEVEYDDVVEALSKFVEKEVLKSDEIDLMIKHYLVGKNVFFVNPMDNSIKPQSKLDLLAIRKVLEDLRL